MIRKHAQRLLHYIETLEAQAEIIRPKAVGVAMHWLETMIHGLDELPPALPPLPKPPPPYIEPWKKRAQPEPWIQPQQPHPILPDVTMYRVYPVPYISDKQQTPWQETLPKIGDWPKYDVSILCNSTQLSDEVTALLSDDLNNAR